MIQHWKPLRSTGARAAQRRFSPKTAVLVLLTGLVAMAAEPSSSWTIGVVDGSLGGDSSSLQIDKFGNAHVAYEGQGVLQYSFWDHNLKRWFTMNVDKTVGFCSMALDSKQRPHISYPQFGPLRYAHWDGSSWQKETIAVPSQETTFYTSISLDRDDNPSISYYEHVLGSEETLRMRVVAKEANVWKLRTVDATRGSGKFNSVAVDSAGRPHIAYANVLYENSSLRYAFWDGKRWNREILEGEGMPGTYRQAVMLILDKHDNPHIAYSDVLNQIAKYATKANGKWSIEEVDPIGRAAYPDRNGIALDEDGTPYISYYDEQNGILKVAHKVNQKWVTEVVDEGFAGYTSSLQIHDGIIWLTYSGGAGSGLKFARRPIPTTATATRSQVLSSPGNTPGAR